MKEYTKPYIEEEIIVIEDVIATSIPTVDEQFNGFENPDTLPFN